ncbi:hypothetical protein FF100_01150 [Methylobacterium terricola]|uniref:Uncharacterized protein n=1 Tax=Methylobacterium terricola TaxID=2583531 RepID=A0A5C4LM45_9HYPH|nr:hypothetical protein [Methylobacterium terricola]TNC15902.1 hypothetical protein FF100_01150 [Methylobacterium terricola]
MIARLISTWRPHRMPEAGETAPEGTGEGETCLAAPPEAVAHLPPMIPLTPPPAVNDGPEGALYDEVAAALRAAGYLPGA